MRWLPLLVLAFATAASASDQLSNPAFLGIGMNDIPSPGIPSTCQVSNVTRGSGAKAAGMISGDVIRSIGGKPVADCNAVLATVQSHAPGDEVEVEVLRYGSAMKLRATLMSRDEILRRRLVGAPVVTTELWGVGEDRTFDLSANRGKTTVVGWFDPKCVRCDSVFAKLSDWSKKQVDKPGAPPMPLAVTRPTDPNSRAKDVAKTSTFKGTATKLDIPLALADAMVYDEFTLPDVERVHFTVVDCRGVVQYVAPVAADGADTDAAMDELFAAAEQASRVAIKQR
ncbi:MAG: PDZ domain-containing protein [Kofleriaceae bacterium]